MSTQPSNTPRKDLTLELTDGRRLAYAEWGDPDGRPVLFLHRSPGSRLFDPNPEATAGVRLVTVDRPGYGGTDPVADASFSVVAKDLSALVESLDMTDIALIGWSGGGQFAVASVAAFEARLGSMTLVCTPAPDDEIPWFPDETRPMLPAMRAGPVGALPGISGGFEPLVADPKSLAASDPSPADADARALPGVPDALTSMMREAGRQGGAGIAFDVVAGGRKGTLPVDAVNVPTWLWYGAGDEYIGLEHGRWYADQIAGSHLEIVQGAGHLLPILRWHEILAGAIGR
jgi:pimeloyl-ACP methyl ester carboxylesterase